MDKEILEKIQQLLEDNQLTCQYCKYSHEDFTRGNDQYCYMYEIDRADNDYCSSFEYKK